MTEFYKNFNIHHKLKLILVINYRLTKQCITPILLPTHNPYMKKAHYIFLILITCLGLNLNAQLATSVTSGIPQKFSYSSQVRDANEEILANQFISLRFTIRSGSQGGAAIYVETDTTTTSPNGIFTVVIGGGSILSGKFDSIQWQQANMYLQIEMDPEGGTNYTNMGTSQLVSFPYAIAAGNGLESIKYDSTGTVVIRTADTKTTSSTNASWLTNGNAATGANSFIGTTDNSDLILKRMNAEGLRIRIGNAVTIPGKLGLGVTAPVTTLDVNGGVTLRDTTFNVSGNFTLNAGNRSMIFLNSSVSATTTCTMADGLQRGQIVIISMLGSRGVSFVNNGPVNNTRVNTDGKGVNSHIGDAVLYTEGNTLTLLWNGADWVEIASSMPKP